MSKYIWVDPPSGWRYGFPKLWAEHRDNELLRWLAENGYPQELIEDLGGSFSIRCWEATDEDVSKHHSNNL